MNTLQSRSVSASLLLTGVLLFPVAGTVGCVVKKDADDGKLEQLGKDLDEASDEIKDEVNDLEKEIKDD